MLLEQVDVGVHPSGGGGAEGTGGETRGGLGRAGVVDAVVLHVLGEPFAVVDAFLELGVGDVASHDHRSAERESGLDGQLRERASDLSHRLVEIDADHIIGEVGVGDLGEELGRIAFELLEEHTVGGDPPQRLPVGGARDCDGHRARCTVARKADDADIVAEVLAAELCADARALGHGEERRLHLEIPETLSVLVALDRKCVEVAGRGHLRRLERELRRGSADDHGEVVRRAGRGAEQIHLGGDEVEE